MPRGFPRGCHVAPGKWLKNMLKWLEVMRVEHSTWLLGYGPPDHYASCRDEMCSQAACKHELGTLNGWVGLIWMNSRVVEMFERAEGWGASPSGPTPSQCHHYSEPRANPHENWQRVGFKHLRCYPFKTRNLTCDRGHGFLNLSASST